MNTPQPASLPTRPADPDEINLLEYAYVLVKHKRLIIGLTLLGMIIGLVAALIKGPVFVADVLIAPRESDAQKTPNLGGLGALGGLVAAQLAFGSNPGLDRIETILGTRKFNAELIGKYGLLPDLYRVFWPKAYRKFYDREKKQWRQTFVQPQMGDIGGFLAKKVLKRETSKTSKTMTISVSTRDSILSSVLLSSCVEYLNQYIREDIQHSAGANVKYLDSTLINVADPLLREKVQSLIASEIEKMMVVSKEAFQVVDPVDVGRSFRHKRVYPLALGLGLLALAVFCVVFAHAFGAGEKTMEDRQFVEGIGRELRRW